MASRGFWKVLKGFITAPDLIVVVVVNLGLVMEFFLFCS